MASSVIGALRVDLGINSAQFTTQLKQTQSQINAFAANAKRSFAGLSDSIRTLSVVATAVMGGSFLFAVKKGIEAGDRIAKTAQRIGITAESYQELAYAASLAGVSQEDFDKSLEQMNRRLGEVNVKGTAAQKTLANIGITTAQIKGQSPDKVFGLILDRISKIADPMQRAAIAQELFGRSGQKLLVLAKDGAAGLRAMGEEARRLGFVISTETLEKTEKASDEFDRIGKAMQYAGIQIGAGFLPALESIRAVMTSQGFQDGIKTVAENMGRFVKFLVDNKDEIIAVTAAFITFSKVTAATRNPLVGLAAGVGAGIAVGEALRGDLEKTERELERLERQAARLRETLTTRPVQAGAAGAGMWDTQNRLIATQVEIDKTKKKLDDLRAKATQQEPTAPDRAPTRIDVTAQADVEAANKLIEELTFKTRLARGEFSAFAQGFAEAAHGAGLFGTALRPAVTTVAELPAHLRRVNEAMQRLKDAEQLKSIAKGIGDAFGSAFESAIVDAKSFQEVIRSLYKDLLRLFIRKLITEPLGNALTAGVGGLIPGRATGGPVMAGQMYMVGERGRELFVPNTDGRIIPNGQLERFGGGGLTYAPVIDMRGADQAAVARMEVVLREHSRQISNQQRAMNSAQHEQRTGVMR